MDGYLVRMSSETWEKLSRRRFLTGGMTAVAAMLAPSEMPFSQSRKPAESNKISEPFTQPPLETSKNGKLETQLRVVQADVPVPGGVRLEQTRCYNGSVPGPTLRLRPGEELRLKLSNDLPREPCSKEHVNQPHCFNTTNIHTHGLHDKRHQKTTTRGTTKNKK